MNSIVTLEAFLDDPQPVGPLLPSFGLEQIEDPPPDLDLAETDAVSKAYEIGFEAGREARDLEIGQSQARLAAEFQEVLHALTFTWEEARAQVVTSVVPVLRAVTGRVLPALAAQTWGQHVIEELSQVVQAATDAPITVTLAPQSHQLLTPYLAGADIRPFRLETDPDLGLLQASFRFGTQESLLDLDGLVTAIGERVEAALADVSKGAAHG